MTQAIIRAQVHTIAPLTDSILQIILRPETYVSYYAGQYLKILIEGEELSYSIANAPLGSHTYELHIRHTQNNPHNVSLLEHIKNYGHVDVRLPFGECSFEALDPKRPIVFIAGGTGFAPVNAMIEQLLAISDPRPFELFWGARSQSDLYMNEKMITLQTHVGHFKYHAFLSQDNKSNLTHSVLATHAHDLNQWQFVLSGPFDMIYKTRDILINHGIPRQQLFSDAFAYE